MNDNSNNPDAEGLTDFDPLGIDLIPVTAQETQSARTRDGSWIQDAEYSGVVSWDEVGEDEDLLNLFDVL